MNRAIYILAAAIFLATTVAVLMMRYEITPPNERGLAYRMDRITGETDVLLIKTYHPVVRKE